MKDLEEYKMFSVPNTDSLLQRTETVLPRIFGPKGEVTGGW
jgi:hypothetical protein